MAATSNRKEIARILAEGCLRLLRQNAANRHLQANLEAQDFSQSPSQNGAPE